MSNLTSFEHLTEELLKNKTSIISFNCFENKYSLYTTESTKVHFDSCTSEEFEEYVQNLPSKSGLIIRVEEQKEKGYEFRTYKIFAVVGSYVNNKTLGTITAIDNEIKELSETIELLKEKRTALQQKLL